MSKNLPQILSENKALKQLLGQYQNKYGCCPHVDDSLLKGSYRVVKTITDRDSIPCCYRKKGMRVVVIEDESPYTEYRLLSPGCKQNQWEAITSTLQVFEENVKFKEGYENDEEEEELFTQKQLNEYLYNKINTLTLIHNELDGLQGGQEGEYYHFTESQHERLADLVYQNLETTISTTPSNAERGTSTAISLNYNIESKDDTIISASINQGIGDVTSDVDDGSKTVSGGTSAVNKTFTITVDYERKGVPDTEVKSTTFTTYVPQWAGWSSEDDFVDDYSAINSESNLQKYVQSSASINKATSPTNEYIWFISNKNNATIRDTNDFVQTVGTWGDGVSEFYRKSLLLTLADGVTTATVYLYRSRNTKNLTSFTYKIS